MRLEPGQAAGAYEVEARIGEGGMASVYRVRRRSDGTPFALKVLHRAQDRLRRRLIDEGRLMMRRLDHPNLVRVVDVIPLGEQPALILEYVDGPSLEDLLDLGLQWSVSDLDAVAGGLLRGLAHAHAQGVVHRDVKPSNVLVEVSALSITPKIVDFGIAKDLRLDAFAGTTTACGMGTPGYASLEHMAGADPTPTMDVFSMGAVLFELVEGRPAFEDHESWLDAIRTDAYPRPLRADLPDRIQRAIAQALCAPDKRVADGRALLAVWDPPEHATPRPQTVQALQAWRRLRHLRPQRLESPDLLPEERAHLERCVSCRSERHQLLHVFSVGSIPTRRPRATPPRRAPPGWVRAVRGAAVAMARYTTPHGWAPGVWPPVLVVDRGFERLDEAEHWVRQVWAGPAAWTAHPDEARRVVRGHPVSWMADGAIAAVAVTGAVMWLHAAATPGSGARIASWLQHLDGRVLLSWVALPAVLGAVCGAGLRVWSSVFWGMPGAVFAVGLVGAAFTTELVWSTGVFLAGGELGGWATVAFHMVLGALIATPAWPLYLWARLRRGPRLLALALLLNWSILVWSALSPDLHALWR